MGYTLTRLSIFAGYRSEAGPGIEAWWFYTSLLVFTNHDHIKCSRDDSSKMFLKGGGMWGFPKMGAVPQSWKLPNDPRFGWLYHVISFISQYLDEIHMFHIELVISLKSHCWSSQNFTGWIPSAGWANIQKRCRHWPKPSSIWEPKDWKPTNRLFQKSQLQKWMVSPKMVV